MGKFIVIEVDDNGLADGIVKKFSGSDRWRVVGIFARPQNHCNCPLELGDYNSRKRVARGAKYGWWIHNVPFCKRPRRGTHQLENLITLANYPVNPEYEYTQRLTTLNIADVLTTRIRRR